MTDLALPSQTRRIAAILVQPWFGYLLLFLVLLVLMPPNGVLSDNEENYFQLASLAVTGTPGGPNSAVFDTVYHRYISELILGNMIALIGFEGTQIATRLLTAAAFTFLLPLLLGTFALSALDAALVVMIFELFFIPCNKIRVSV